MFDVPEYSVSEFSASIKRVIEDAFGFVRIKGEVSGVKLASSGHLYFNLKDQDAVISAVCFRAHARLINFEVTDGIEVVAAGKVTTYQGRSNYQIVVQKLEIAGIGSIMEEIEKLRKKLLAEGLFDDKYKKQIPYWSRKVGVITSKTGSVIEDIKHRIIERCPSNIIIFHSAMQGAQCVAQVILGIEYFNNLDQNDRPEVVIIARGGGSFEDLLPFNDERLVRAVFASKIPIISAVGHETDTSMIDYVADLRAPTPTAAAEMATPLLSDLKIKLNSLSEALDTNLKYFIEDKANLLGKIGKYLINPNLIHQQIADDFNKLEDNFIFLINNIFTEKYSRLNSKLLSRNLLVSRMESLGDTNKYLQSRLRSLLSTQIDLWQNNLYSLNKLLESSSYKNTLSRGFALVKNDQGQIVDSIALVQDSQKMDVEVKDGKFSVKLLKT